MRNGILPRYRRSQGLTGIFGRRVDADSLLNAPHTGRTQPVYMCSTPTTSTPNRRPASKHDHLFQTYNGLPALSNSPPTSLLHNRHSLRPRLRPSHCLQRQLRLPPQFRMEHRLCRCFWHHHRRSRHPDLPLPKGLSPSSIVPPQSQPLTQELTVVPSHHPPRRPPRNPVLCPPCPRRPRPAKLDLCHRLDAAVSSCAVVYVPSTPAPQNPTTTLSPDQPPGINAFLYLSTARLSHLFFPSSKFLNLPPRRVTQVFILADVLSFFIQAAGGGMMAMADASDRTLARTGQKVYMAGIAVQSAFVVVFCFEAGRLLQRMRGEGVGGRRGTGVVWGVVGVGGLIVVSVSVPLLMGVADVVVGESGVPAGRVWMGGGGVESDIGKRGISTGFGCLADGGGVGGGESGASGCGVEGGGLELSQERGEVVEVGKG